MSLNRFDLDQAKKGCNNEHDGLLLGALDGVIYLQAKCHPKSPLCLRTEDNSVLIVSCYQCQSDVAKISVAFAEGE